MKLDMETLTLRRGTHETREEGLNALEAVALLAGEEHSDAPSCVSPVIAAFVRTWNDDLNDEDRHLLRPLLPLLVGTSVPDLEEARANMVVDWLARECAPAWLRLAGLTVEAEALEALAPLASSADFKRAQPVLEVARSKSAAAWDAAWAAARDAAWDAARDAARDAAWDAARDAAWDAARDAAWDAARAAARDAAWDAARAAARAAASRKLRPTVEILQASAVKLVERMCALSAKDASS